MSKFNLYAADSSIVQRPAFQKLTAAAEEASGRYFAAALGLWFVVMFAIGCLILTA